MSIELQLPPRNTAYSTQHSLSIKSQVELNRKVLVDLATYEPKTFKPLAALAQRRQQEGFAAALGDGKEAEGIFSRVVQHHSRLQGYRNCYKQDRTKRIVTSKSDLYLFTF